MGRDYPDRIIFYRNNVETVEFWPYIPVIGDRVGGMTVTGRRWVVVGEDQMTGHKFVQVHVYLSDVPAVSKAVADVIEKFDEFYTGQQAGTNAQMQKLRLAVEGLRKTL